MTPCVTRGSRFSGDKVAVVTRVTTEEANEPSDQGRGEEFARKDNGIRKKLAPTDRTIRTERRR